MTGEIITASSKALGERADGEGDGGGDGEGDGVGDSEGDGKEDGLRDWQQFGEGEGG